MRRALRCFMKNNAVPLNSVGAVLRLCGRMVVTFFVLGQVVFLLASNFLSVEKPLRTELKNRIWTDSPAEETAAYEYFAGQGRVHEGYDETRNYTNHWSQLTGQPQNWILFAPFIGKVIPFPAVELRWDDQDWPDWAEPPPLANPRPVPVVILSDNEPADRRDFIRFGKFRVRKYESELTPYPPASEDGVFDPETSAWRTKIRDCVLNEPECTYNYLRWRLEVYARANPDLPPPTQVILLVRAYKIPKPPGPDPWDWYDLGEHRVARWLPSAPLNTKDYQPVECYDPVEHHFGRLEK